MPEAYVGLGSNVEPGVHFRRAVAAFAERHGAARCSSIYASPADGAEAPDYWNAVVELTATGGARALIEHCRELEQAAGRVRPSSRVSLDLDLLVYGARVDPALRLPRADVLRKPFVLGPLAELAPDLVHPVTGDRIGAVWRAAASEAPRLVRLGTLDEVLALR